MHGLLRLVARREATLTFVVTAGLLLGGASHLAGGHRLGDVLWVLAAIAALAPLAAETARNVLQRRPGVDIVALLALAGALVAREYLVGAVIALMYASGQALESYASGSAARELRALLAHAPRVAHRYEGGSLITVPLDGVQPGDLLLVQPGEVVPVDGVLQSSSALLDEATLSGEARPVERPAGDKARSGAVNVGSPFDLRATAAAAQSTYAGIVRLVQEGEASKAPFVRIADRFALGFVPLTLLIAGAAWAVSGSFTRALAVLVVATPCPLILAAPVAIVSGISRAARRGVIVKGGGALEALGSASVLLLDKTGTITAGHPELADIVAPDGNGDEILRLAASLDQVSQHVLADALVQAARQRGLPLAFPSDTREELGRGLRGKVGDTTVAVGKAEWLLAGAPLPGWAHRVRRRASFEGLSTIFVAIDGRLAGSVLLADRIRPDAPRTLRRLRRAGIERVLMVTGDRADVAASIGSAVGVDEVLAERSPAEKLDAVRAAHEHGSVIMVGDGVNDAPALAAADVGVAMGARGATASSEAADVVLIVDKLDRLADALGIAHRSRQIALQSVVAGMGLSFAAMIAAAFGAIPPVAGAILQEAIDVAAILNALRALGGGDVRAPIPLPESVVFGEFRSEHLQMAALIARLRGVADQLDILSPTERLQQARDIYSRLMDEVLAHDVDEEARLFPLVDRLSNAGEITASLVRVHREIAHQTHVLGELLEEIAADGWEDGDILDMRRILYGLHAILRLHMTQEDEEILSLVEEPGGQPALTAPTSIAGSR
jgi:heavy metal translocating P-type ATPase